MSRAHNQPVAIVVLLLLDACCASCAQTTLPAGGTPNALCELQDSRINEASGIVASRLNPGCYYVHNDSGDQPRVFLIDRDGRTRLTIRLSGAAATDYEDIAVAPGGKPGSFDVCVADIGDNRATRSRVTIYRFPEVEAKEGQEATVDVQAAAYNVHYADGPADAEAFFVHPRTGDGYILTKRLDGRSAVYKLPAPWNASEESVLPRLLVIELPPAWPLARVVTAADISPDGRRVAVRCYADGWEWRLPREADDRDFDRIFKTRPAALSLAIEPQGEAICYSADGRFILTVSEGSSATLYEMPASSE